MFASSTTFSSRIPEQGVRFIAVEELDASDAQAVQARVRRRILRTFSRCGRSPGHGAVGLRRWVLARCDGKFASPPRIAPARGPPVWDEGDFGTIFLNSAQPEPRFEFDQRPPMSGQYCAALIFGSPTQAFLQVRRALVAVPVLQIASKWDTWPLMHSIVWAITGTVIVVLVHE